MDQARLAHKIGSEARATASRIESLLRTRVGRIEKLMIVGEGKKVKHQEIKALEKLSEYLRRVELLIQSMP